MGTEQDMDELERVCDRSEKVLAQGVAHYESYQKQEGVIPVDEIGQLVQRMRESLGPHNRWDVMLDKTAYTADEVRKLMLEYGAQRVWRDREHRPADGWVQRGEAVGYLYTRVEVVLEGAGVPADHRQEIEGHIKALFRDWRDAGDKAK